MDKINVEEVVNGSTTPNVNPTVNNWTQNASRIAAEGILDSRPKIKCVPSVSSESMNSAQSKSDSVSKNGPTTPKSNVDDGPIVPVSPSDVPLAISEKSSSDELEKFMKVLTVNKKKRSRDEIHVGRISSKKVKISEIDEFGDGVKGLVA